MDARLQKMLDNQEIRELIEAYVHACDRADSEAVADVYAVDSWDDHGPMKSDGKSFAKQVVASLLEHWNNCIHVLGQSRIRVAGDEAGAETYFHASLTRDVPDGLMLDEMVGRYVDSLERRDGIWSIRHRVCISEWSASRAITEDFLNRDRSFATGLRSTGDPSYAVLGLARGGSRIGR